MSGGRGAGTWCGRPGVVRLPAIASIPCPLRSAHRGPSRWRRSRVWRTTPPTPGTHARRLREQAPRRERLPPTPSTPECRGRGVIGKNLRLLPPVRFRLIDQRMDLVGAVQPLECRGLFQRLDIPWREVRQRRRSLSPAQREGFTVTMAAMKSTNPLGRIIRMPPGTVRFCHDSRSGVTAGQTSRRGIRDSHNTRGSGEIKPGT